MNKIKLLHRSIHASYCGILFGKLSQLLPTLVYLLKLILTKIVPRNRSTTITLISTLIFFCSYRSINRNYVVHIVGPLTQLHEYSKIIFFKPFTFRNPEPVLFGPTCIMCLIFDSIAIPTQIDWNVR